VTPSHGPWVDVHAHPGRCFLAGLPGDDGLVARLGSETCSAAVATMQRAAMAAVSFATVSDLRVIGFTADGGLRATRPFEPGEAYADHRRQLEALTELTSPLDLSVVRGAADVRAAHAAGRSAALLTCEGADFVEGQLDRIAEAHAAGVRSITLVHYRDNGLGDLQTEPAVHGGLTAAGREAIAEMNRLGMIVDLAHATFATTVDAVEASSTPIMVSHTHLEGESGPTNARLISADHARAVAASGGLIGGWPAGVRSRTLADFVDEVSRLVDVAGIDHVAIGTDMDANYRPVLTRYDQFAIVHEELLERGFTADESDQVLGGNAVALIERVCG
jgi:membrane dipeptidase